MISSASLRDLVYTISISLTTPSSWPKPSLIALVAQLRWILFHLTRMQFTYGTRTHTTLVIGTSPFGQILLSFACVSLYPPHTRSTHSGTVEISSFHRPIFPPNFSTTQALKFPSDSDQSEADNLDLDQMATSGSDPGRTQNLPADPSRTENPASPGQTRGIPQNPLGSGISCPKQEKVPKLGTYGYFPV